jgi:ribosomal protein S18 acetylase RimI-like enzyme
MRRITTAGELDSNRIAALVNLAFLVEQFFIERDRTNPAAVRDLMKKGKFLLAGDEKNILGCIYMEQHGDRGYFGMLSIDPAEQRTGVGRLLVDTAEEHFREAGCKFCDLKIVNVRTDLHDLYHRWGYVDTGTAVYDDPTPTKIPVHFITMSKPLL